MNFVDRVKNILLQPKEELPVAQSEPTDVAGFYKDYLVLLAALPAVGTILSFGGYLGFGTRFKLALVSYLVTLGSFYVSALIVDALAPTFDSVKSQLNALKLVGYASTPSMVAGALNFLPGIGTLASLAAAVYGIYMFYIGLPVFMSTPKEKTIVYMIAAAIASIIVYAILSAILLPIFGLSMVNWRG